MKTPRLLALALFTLVAVYALWFGQDRHVLAALLIFALPPALLGLAALRGWPLAGLSAGLVALMWFSHGILVAWTRAAERPFAFAEILLALAVIYLASMPGLRARFSKRR